MALKKHHKIMIGGLGSVMIIFMVVTGGLMYTLFVKQNINYNTLSTEVAEIQNKINELTTNLIETKANLEAGLEENKQTLKLLKSTTSADFSGIIEDAIKSVVTVQTDVAQGTGFLITDEGHIITNAHVLAGGHEVFVLNSNQQKIDAEFIGYNGEFDIALLKLQGNYNALKLADSDNVQIGEKVIAIGNPLGLQFSVSEGIVSATNREGINEVGAYIQTDAALNPGNSGGPLINKEGEVIGINNFKVERGESLGFALESNYIKEVVNAIAEEKLHRSLI